ncbi:MAG TPA: beta-galactosidase GalB [Gemmatimonadaceae bacterium]|jgi:beta-galactosidase
MTNRMMRIAGMLLAMPLLTMSAQSSPRSRVSLDSGWRFRIDGGSNPSLSYDALKPWILPSGNAFVADASKRFAAPPEPFTRDIAYMRGDFDDRSWQAVTLPHDWAITGPFITNGDLGGMGRLPTAGIGWYRRSLDIPARDAGRSVYLDVDGAMAFASVWLNGHLVGGWPYGYASWRLDLTPYALPGRRNQLTIRLENRVSSSRWYPGAGIYRNVWMTTADPVHVAQWGTFVRTRDVSRASATLDLDVTIENSSKHDAIVSAVTSVFPLDADGRRVGAAVARLSSQHAHVAAGGATVVKASASVAQPRLWGPPPTQRPNRYVAVTELTSIGRVVDRYETRFGIRDVRFTGDSGVLVNGEHVYIAGVNNHHDLGALGAAFNVRAAERQLAMLREMGANAIRMSHNPPAPELLALTDSLGFLVMDEAFDVWLKAKMPNDFHLIYADWHEQDLRAMIRRDRNNPSVVLWSIGNEVGEQMTGEDGARVARELVAIAHDEDPTRPTTTAMNYSQADHVLPSVVDVISLNYQGAGVRTAPGRYPDFHAAFPTKGMLGSEVAAAFSSRGTYLFPVASGVGGAARQDRGSDSITHQVSSYELYAADFGSSADRVFASQDRNPYVGGEFVWTGWDYLGEPTPFYSSRSSYFGIIDLAGFKKDRFYIYQSKWRPDLPMAHILPHWTWPERVGLVTPIHVFTSGDEAELFLNGKSLGRRKKGAFEYRLRWDSVTYEPGTVEVVAYKHGQRWATDRVVTAGIAALLTASPDRPTIHNDGRDLSFVSIAVNDANGNFAPRASNLIRFAVDGPGEIVATDNGDATDFYPFPSHERHAFNGRALVIVRAKAGQSGRITITATSSGLSPITTTVAATP